MNSKVVSLIEIKAQTDENENFEQVRSLDLSYENRRFICQFGSTTLIKISTIYSSLLTRKKFKTNKMCLERNKKSTRKSSRISKY